MAGAVLHRGRPVAQTAIIALTVALPLLALDMTSARAASGQPRAATGQHRLTLPKPVTEVDPLATPDLQLRPDRLLKSQVPGQVVDRENVRVALGPTGAPATVTDTQQLT